MYYTLCNLFKFLFDYNKSISIHFICIINFIIDNKFYYQYIIITNIYNYN